MESSSSTQRILIVRLSAMGDILHALPAVTALRQALPNAFMGWVIEDRWADLVRVREAAPRGPGMPLLDRVHYTDIRKWKGSLLSGTTRKAVRGLREELRAERYDVALDLQGSIRSALIARMSRAPQRVGAAKPRESLARWFYTKTVPTPGVHVIDQSVETAAAVLSSPLAVVPAQLPVDPEAERWRDELIRGKEKFVVINPGAGWGAKCWPAERFGVVAAELSAAGWHIFVNAGPGEDELGRQVIAASQQKAELLSCSIAQLISLMRRASLFIGGDTGPMHLAAALNVPVVGIFGPTDPNRNGPYGTRRIVLRHPESKRDHARRSQPEAGLLTIATGHVVDAAHTLLEGR